MIENLKIKTIKTDKLVYNFEASFEIHDSPIQFFVNGDVRWDGYTNFEILSRDMFDDKEADSNLHVCEEKDIYSMAEGIKLIREQLLTEMQPSIDDEGIILGERR